MRRESVEELRATLDRDVEVFWDENPVPSADPRQRWAVADRAWASYSSDADWHLVLQDDIEVSRDLLAGLEKALDVLGPDGLVSAYTGTGRPDQRNVLRALEAADRHRLAWTSTRSLNWGCGILAPTSSIPGMLAWCNAYPRARSNTDHRIGVYYRDILRWRTWYTVPSLVEHKMLPSLVGNDADGSVRVAHRFHAGSALDIDWTRTPGVFHAEL